MPRDALILLEDVRAAAASVQAYTRGMTLQDYRASKLVRRAVEREFEIMGEALRRPVERQPRFQAALPQTPVIIGFRNVLAHGYDAIDDQRVWNTIVDDLPPLLKAVEAMILRERGEA